MAELERAAAAGVKIINYNTKVDTPLMTTYVSVDNSVIWKCSSAGADTAVRGNGIMPGVTDTAVGSVQGRYAPKECRI